MCWLLLRLISTDSAEEIAVPHQEAVEEDGHLIHLWYAETLLPGICHRVTVYISSISLTTTTFLLFLPA